jgi:dipeptidyl aminopeptidase/acylaminoacyl peptidase
MVNIVRANNKPVKYIVFPDEGHEIKRPENKLRLYAELAVFLAKYLGGRVEPASEEEDITAFLA